MRNMLLSLMIAGSLLVTCDNGYAEDSALITPKSAEERKALWKSLENNEITLDMLRNNPPRFIAVDLDGDGLDIIPKDQSNVYFDIDGDGEKEHTAWIGPDDAFYLPIYTHITQKHKDNVQDVVPILLSNAYFFINMQDYNGDGYINEKPIGFRGVLWRDANTNGVWDDDERLKKNRETYNDVKLEVNELQEVQTSKGIKILSRSTIDIGEQRSRRSYYVFTFSNQGE